MYTRFHKGLRLLGNLMNIDTSTLTKKWQVIYESRYKYRGKVDAVKFMKELNTAAERYALHQPIKPIPWTRSDKEGFPSILGTTFKMYLRSKDPKQVIMALSVMRSCEDLMLPISKDIGTIIEPCNLDMATLESVLDFIPRWVRSLKRDTTLPEMEYHLSVKNGPNGQAMLTSDSDIKAVNNDPPIYEAIRKVEELMDDYRPMDTPDVEIDGDAIHSRLCQFPDKAGKTRTIAVIDYYSQRCLKPLHKMLMNFLSSLVSDGTFSHQNVGKYAQKMTSEKKFIYCADMTAFTDRFPSEIQRVLLFELLKNDDLAENLWTLLAKRTFVVQWSGERVTYQCGQPMGAYASWPLCSLAHHLIVEYSAYKAGTRSIKSKYRLIGDDVIITDRLTSQIYRDTISALGVEINQGKTVESPFASEKSGAEVAKQLYLNGICLSPITPGFIRDLRKPYMFNTCIGVLSSRYEFLDTNLPPMLIKALFGKPKTQKLVWLLASNPFSGIIKPGNPGYNEFSPWRDVENKNTEFSKFVVRRMLKQALSLANKFVYGKMKGESPWEDSTRPVPLCIEYAENDIYEHLQNVGSGLGLVSGGVSFEYTMAQYDFIPDPFLPYQQKKEMRCRRMSSLIEDFYKEEINKV